MTTEIMGLLGQATTQPWTDAIDVAYGRSQVVLATISFAMFALTFTAVSTLTRIKDKLYDEPAYQDRVKRLQSIDPDLKDYKPFQQLNRVFTLARWMCLISGIFNLVLVFRSTWWLAILAYAAFAVLIGSVAYFAHLFHANLSEITRIDQQKLDEARRKQRDLAEADENKKYIKLHGV